MGYNPCYCWNLKDGCITIGIWSLIWTCIEIGVFGWQTWLVRWKLDHVTNKLGRIMTPTNEYGRTDWTQYYVSYEEKKFLINFPRVKFVQIFASAQMIIFGWQTSVIQLLRNKAANSRLGPNLGVWVPSQPRWPGIYEEYWMNDKERFYMSIFIIQIINLIASFFLLFASIALIYGVYTGSKHLVWPWLPCMAMSIICSTIYCILWWAGNVESYWLILTVVEFLSVLVNIYCLLCVTVQYNRILKGYTVQEDDEYKPKIVEEYVPRDDNFQEEKTKNLIPCDEEYPPRKPPRYFTQVARQDPELTRTHINRRSRRNDCKSVQSPGFKARFTEEWIRDVSENGKSEKVVLDDGWNEGVKDHKTELYEKAKSLEALNMERQKEQLRTCRSKDSVTSRSHRHCHHSHHHHHHHRDYCHKKKRDHKRSINGVNEVSSNDEDGDSSDDNNNGHDYDTVRHARSCSSRRSSRSLNSAKYTDHNSDTGYSATGTSAAGSESEPVPDDRSICSRRRKHKRHCCCKHSHTKDPSNGQAKRRLRDVKRADDDRQKRQAQKIVQVGNDLISSDSAPEVQPVRPLPPGAVPVLPPGTISIPQNIVIPGATNGTNPSQPQKYHINSEITIRYDHSDEDEHRLQNLHKNQAINDSADFSSGLEGRRSTPSTAPFGSMMGSGSNITTRNARGAFSGVSSESKRYASTAV